MQRVLFQESGQQLEHTPPRPLDGGEASYLIEDLTRPLGASERVLAEGEATVSALVLVLSGPAGAREPAATRLPVEALELAEPGWHWLEGDGDGELVFVEALVDGQATLVARHPLIGSYPAGSTLRPLTISAPFPDEHVSVARFVVDEVPLRIVWRFSIDERLHKVQEQLRVQRHVGLGDISEARVVELVREAWPDLVARMPRTGKLPGWVRVCSRFVANKLRAHGLDPARYLAGEAAVDLVAARLALHAAHNGETTGNLPRSDFLELTQAAWSTSWQDLVIGAPNRETATLDRRDRGTSKPTRVGHQWTLEL